MSGRNTKRSPLLAIALLVVLPATAFGGFSPSLVQFRTTIQDDGKTEPGGWQEATVRLNFVDSRTLIPKAWSCRVKVGMPLRAAAHGRILAEAAAEMSASVATGASQEVMHRQPEWLTAEFCIEFIAEMNHLFREDYRRLGARVNGP